MLSYSEATDCGGNCRSIPRRLLVIFSLAPPSSLWRILVSLDFLKIDQSAASPDL